MGRGKKAHGGDTGKGKEVEEVAIDLTTARDDDAFDAKRPAHLGSEGQGSSRQSATPKRPRAHTDDDDVRVTGVTLPPTVRQ